MKSSEDILLYEYIKQKKEYFSLRLKYNPKDHKGNPIPLDEQTRGSFNLEIKLCDLALKQLEK